MWKGNDKCFLHGLGRERADVVTPPKKVKSAKKKSGRKGRRSSLRSKSMVLTSPVPAQPSPKLLMSRSLTQPVSPQLNIDKRFKDASVKKCLSSEDITMAKIEEEKKAEKKKIEQAKAMYLRLKAKGFQPKAVSAAKTTMKKLTIPKAPNSILQKRLGEKVPSTIKKSPQKVEAKVITSSPRAGPTIPVPFSFATDHRIKLSASTKSSSLTAGELAQKFFQDPRSHYVPENAAKKLTQAHSPPLRTKQRSLSASKERPLSYDERLEQEMKEMLKRSFKARELDRRIFESNGELGVPKVEAKPLTIPQEFHLESEKRAAECKEKEKKHDEEEESFQFKARPLPDFIREPPKQPPTPSAKTSFKPTVPVSPKLHGGERAASAPARRQKPHHTELEKKKQEESEAWKRVKKDLTKLTMPEEFHLSTSERGAAYQAMMQEYQRQEEELLREQAKVKALPMPSLDKVFVPKPSNKPTTAPQPFELKSVALHEEAEVRIQMELQKEAEQQKSAFKARPVPKAVLEPPTPVVDRENRAPTVPINVTLTSDLRAEKRKQFDAAVAEKLAMQKRMEEQQLREREEAEKREVATLRRKSIQEGGTVFKAQPVLKHDPFAPKHVPTSPRPVTIPKSPNLRLKERRASSMSANDLNALAKREATPAQSKTPLGSHKKPLRRVSSALPR